MQKVFKLKKIGKVVESFLEFLDLEKVKKENIKNKSLVIGFSGNLGAGKTTFTKELIKQMGSGQNVASPTFVLRRDYEISAGLIPNREGLGVRQVIHIDAYRLEKPEQVYQVISKEELENKENLILIEWPEKVFVNGVGENIFDYIFLFEHIDENTRKITQQS